MKTFKALVFVSVLFIGTVVFAQPPQGGQRGGQGGPMPVPNEEQIQEMVDDLADEISLSEEQEARVLDLYTEHFEQVKELTSGKGRPDREKMDALKTSFEKNVKAELDKDQIKKYQAWLKKQEQRGPRR